MWSGLQIAFSDPAHRNKFYSKKLIQEITRLGRNPLHHFVQRWQRCRGDFFHHFRTRHNDRLTASAGLRDKCRLGPFIGPHVGSVRSFDHDIARAFRCFTLTLFPRFTFSRNSRGFFRTDRHRLAYRDRTRNYRRKVRDCPPLIFKRGA